MAVNVKLLKKVRKLIADEPRRLNMHTWGRFYPKPTKESLPACGTVACLAGWTVLASKPKSVWRKMFTVPDTFRDFLYNKRESSIPVKAARLLGIHQKDCPFGQLSWGKSQVLNWIDEQIAGAK